LKPPCATKSAAQLQSPPLAPPPTTSQLPTTPLSPNKTTPTRSSKVTDALKGLEHVRGVSVDLEAKMATVEVEAPSLMDALNMLPG